MKNTNDAVFTEDPPLFVLKDLTVRALEGEELARAGELLSREHYLGDCPEGRQLLQVVEHRGRWVALLDWGPACWKLADREAHIGWTHQQRAERLGLVVQNRRFLVLGKVRMPNLASRALGLALKALPMHWKARYGYSPLMAETFTDIEQFEGTCYKASNWTALGLTKGFQRHRADYFQKHGRPKKLWVKSLNRNSLRILTCFDVPAAYEPGLNHDTPERDLALHNFLTQIDPHLFARCLSLWLESNLGTLPRALAIDGKWIRERALSVCLSDHETGAPVAVGFAAEVSKTDENKREGEQTVALDLYAKTNLEGATGPVVKSATTGFATTACARTRPVRKITISTAPWPGCGSASLPLNRSCLPISPGPLYKSGASAIPTSLSALSPSYAANDVTLVS